MSPKPEHNAVRLWGLNEPIDSGPERAKVTLSDDLERSSADESHEHSRCTEVGENRTVKTETRDSSLESGNGSFQTWPTTFRSFQLEIQESRRRSLQIFEILKPLPRQFTRSRTHATLPALSNYSNLGQLFSRGWWDGFNVRMFDGPMLLYLHTQLSSLPPEQELEILGEFIKHWERAAGEEMHVLIVW